jgi:hypothetical protein
MFEYPNNRFPRSPINTLLDKERERMDIQSDKNISSINLPAPSSTVLFSVVSIARWLIRFLTLTEEDRMAAGIYLGGDKRGDG